MKGHLHAMHDADARIGAMHGQDFEHMLTAMHNHRVRPPTIDSIHRFVDAAGAFARTLSGGHFGKIGIRIGDDFI